MVSQALTGTAPEPRPATPPVWGSACQITNCDRRRWTLSRSIMSSCKLGPKIRFSHIPIPPLIFHFISHFNFQISLISFHFLPFLFHFIPIGCLSARGRVLNSIPSNRHSGRSIYLLTTLTTLVAIVHYRILNEGPLPRGAYLGGGSRWESRRCRLLQC